MFYSIILIVFLFIFIIFILFLFILKNKIDQLENKIDKAFQGKNNLIPSLYEVTKNDLIKHNEIFKEILDLKNSNFSHFHFYNNTHKTIFTQQKIHKELDFIFRVCHRHKKLIKNNNFFYIKELIFERVVYLGDLISIYKKIIKKYNTLIFIKNVTIIGLLFPIQKKEEI